MDAKAKNLNQIFDSTISFQIPLFQRPYVWDKAKNWEPLWEDIHVLLEYQLEGCQRQHFLGAVVLEQLGNVAGSIETHQVIDGQQRFTTLQLLMLAARDLSHALDDEKHEDRFNDLVANKASKVDFDYEQFKVWPTNRDRASFKTLHGTKDVYRDTGIDLTLDQLKSGQPTDQVLDSRLVHGYLYFFNQIRNWVNGNLDDEEAFYAADQGDRLAALWQVASANLQVVVINLDDDDESQVIFETLNARGTQLLPADLIKNYLFRKAQCENQNIELLYGQYWSDFDKDFWREAVKQGRINRPRIDLFLQHYMTLMMREEIRPAHLFESFKRFVVEQEYAVSEASQRTTPNLSVMPATTEEHLQALSRYSRAFMSFARPEPSSRLTLFLERLKAVDTATVYPLLLLAHDQLLPNQPAAFDELLIVLESFLMRRMICCMTSKNYNRLFLNVIKRLDERGEVSARVLREILQAGGGESIRFPSDQDLQENILTLPLYDRLPQYKVRAVLAAIDRARANSKSEELDLPDGLTIEHIMPKKWHSHWSIPQSLDENPEEKIRFEQKRNRLIDTLGNLTLITGSLNPSLSNGSWRDKRPELARYSKLNLNRYFYPIHDGDDPLVEWDEQRIRDRGLRLFADAINIWPYEGNAEL